MNIDTTRQSNGNMATVTSGAGVPGGAGQIGELFKALIAKKLAAAKAPSAMGQVSAGFSQPEQPTYRPTMGTMQAPAKVGKLAPATRMRRVQLRTVLPSPMEIKGITYDEVPETQLPDGSWSLDAVHGTLAGNEQAARQNLEILNREPSGRGGSSPADDPRMRALVAQQEAARRGPAAPIAPVSRGAQSRGARA